MPGRNLAEWLDYIERIHPKSIQLGLERVAKVRDVLGMSSSAVFFIVAGTNGKGSTCAMLEAILLAAGYRVGLYTSPHLLRYNERVRLDGAPLSDARLCAAFETVERARGELTLTYFEFGTLAAWEIFAAEALDAVILEDGLGGRLDAVNAFDADCALLTSVDLDHTDYLGDTRERIGSEKAGIFRRSKPAIVADPDPPRSVLDHAGAQGVDLWLIGRDFGYRKQGQQWMYWGRGVRRGGLAPPALRGERQRGPRRARRTACASSGRHAGHPQRFRARGAPRAVPSASRPTDGRFGCRAQSAGRGRARGEPRRDGLLSGYLCRFRHVAGQGHCRGLPGLEKQNFGLVRGGPFGATRRWRAGACGCPRERECGRRCALLQEPSRSLCRRKEAGKRK